MISDKTKKLVPFVEAELNRHEYPYPTSLVLAVIQVESAGNPGAVNPSSGASGLMQVMPGTLVEYNKHHERKISLESLRSSTKQGIMDQISVGLWVMGTYLRSAHNWLSQKMPKVGLEDLIKISDHFYAAGPAGTKRKIGDIVPTAKNISEKYPDWSPVRHAKKVWDFTIAENPIWDLNAINRWVTGQIIPKPDDKPIDPEKNKHGFLIAMMIIAIAAYFMERK